MPLSERESFFRIIFGRNEGYVCIAHLAATSRKFGERFFEWPQQEDEMHEFINKFQDKRNLYFCPHIFSSEDRTKEAVLITPSAWADLDTCRPDLLLVEPTACIQSSPNRWQALWIFDRDVKPDKAEELSRRIAYKHAKQGADRSGWDLTQLLRVPGTTNFKYENTPSVEIAFINDNRYRLSDFKEYPETPAYSALESPMPTDLDNAPTGTGEELLNRVPLSPVAWDLFQDTPTVASWSELLWQLMMILFEAGYTREEVYLICREAACNKFARDNRPPVYLWKEVCRGFARAQLHKELLVPKPEEHQPLLSDEEKELVKNAGDTFIERYQKWASSLGDAAPQYHQAGAFVVLSSLLAGNVTLPTSFGNIIPNLWFMILADTTLTRKTTAMDIAMDLAMELDDDVMLATDGSIEGLLTAMSTRPGRPSVFLRDEFSGLLESMSKKDYMAGTAELLTKLYDNKVQKRVLRKETVEVKDPRLIIFAGGIKERVTNILTDEMVASGFMPRFIFITAESDISRLKPIGPPEEKMNTGRDAILEELTDMVKYYTNNNQQVTVGGKPTDITLTRIPTSARLTPDAWLRYNQLENTLVSEGLKSSHPDLLTPVGDRLAKSILKAAVLIAASRQKAVEVVVEMADMLRAIRYGEQWYDHVKDVMDKVGRGPFEKRLSTIFHAIQKGGGARSYLMQAYHMSAKEATAVFETLEQRGLVNRYRVGRTEMYRVAEDANG